MKHCVVCGALLATPLETYGDYDWPMCQSCWLEPDEWATLEIFVHVRNPDGSISLCKGRDYDMFFEVTDGVRPHS